MTRLSQTAGTDSLAVVRVIQGLRALGAFKDSIIARLVTRGGSFSI